MRNLFEVCNLAAAVWNRTTRPSCLGVLEIIIAELTEFKVVSEPLDAKSVVQTAQGKPRLFVQLYPTRQQI